MRVSFRRRASVLFAGSALPIVLASAAFACQSTVTLYSSSSSVAQGGTVTVTGNKYNTSAAFGPVQIRLDSRTGPVLASATPVGGNISASVTVPATTSLGYHILIATQYNNTTGAPCTGCPGRASVKVVAPASAAASVGSGLSAPWLPSTPLGLVGVALASLAVAVLRRRRVVAA